MRAIRYARRYRNWAELTRIRDAGRKPRAAVLRCGLRFEAPEDVNVLRVVTGSFLKPRYTPQQFGIGEEDVVVDVGANIGAFAVFAAQRTRGRVVAVEPGPQNLEYLRRNVEHNGCDVEIVEAALCERDGSARLQITDNGSTHSLFGRSGRPAEEPSVEVRAITLPTLLDERSLERIDLLKMDCEGAEGPVLPATPESHLRRVRRIAMEFHDDQSPLSHDELRSLLEEAGYRTRIRWDGSSPTGYLYALR